MPKQLYLRTRKFKSHVSLTTSQSFNFFKPFKNIKTVLCLQAIQKTGRRLDWSKGHSLPTRLDELKGPS